MFAERIGGRSTSLPVAFVGDGHAAQIWAAGRVASDLPKTLDAGGASADCGGDGGGAELVWGLRDHQLPSSTASERSVAGARGGLLLGSVREQRNRCEDGRFLLQLCAQGGDAPGPQAEPRHKRLARYMGPGVGVNRLKKRRERGRSASTRTRGPPPGRPGRAVRTRAEQGICCGAQIESVWG